MTKLYDYSIEKKIIWRFVRTFVATFIVTFALEPRWDYAAVRAALVAGLVALGKGLRELDPEYKTRIHKLPL